MRRLPLLLLAGCAADFTVVDVRDLGPLETSSAVAGRDGGTSGGWGGRSIWFWGDTVLASPDAHGSMWHDNSWAWTEDLDVSDGLDGFRQAEDAAGAPTEIFPITSEELAYNLAHQPAEDGSCLEPCGQEYILWGGMAGVDPTTDAAILSYGKVFRGPGEWNFEYVGTSFMRWDHFEEPPAARDEVAPGTAEPTLLFPAPEPEFGAANLVVDGTLYSWACSGERIALRGCRVGRVPVGRVLERDAWTFFAGHGRWSSDVDDAKVVFHGATVMSVEYSPFLERYLAVYAVWDAVVARTAPAPEGPWSAAKVLFLAEADGIHHASSHPELAREDGRFVTITFLEDVFHLVEVELGR